MPTLDIIKKVSSSALVGGALSNTKKSQRYSSSSNSNKNMILGAFKGESVSCNLRTSNNESLCCGIKSFPICIQSHVLCSNNLNLNDCHNVFLFNAL